MLDEPFLGSAAVAAGHVTPDQLRGPRFARVLTGVFVRAGVEVDLTLRARAASLVSGGRGVVVGWAAAELLGAPCAPAGASVELVVSGRGHARRGLVISKAVLRADEITSVGAVRVTTPVRTAFDLARRAPVLHAIIGVDALRHARLVAPDDVLTLAVRHRGVRGVRQVSDVLRRSTHLSESPMETRIRITIEDAGLPPPVLQYRVGPYRVDLAYPDRKIAIEYDGREHLTPERARRDLRRQAYLTREGWTVLRFSAEVVLHETWKIVSDVRWVLRPR